MSATENTNTPAIITDQNPEVKPAKKKTKVITTMLPGAQAKPKKEKLKDINTATAAAKVKPKETKTEPKATESTRELKYVYPADCITKDDKKTFRRNARAKVARYTKTLTELKASNKQEDKAQLEKETKEFAKYQKQTLTNPKDN